MSFQTENREDGLQSAYSKHERRWKENRYVYPVVSRRSGGVSIGINLNPGKDCSFNCIYCQVNRTEPSPNRSVDVSILDSELEAMLEDEKRGLLYKVLPFSLLPRTARGVRDIAFSGDGEPTASANFYEAVKAACRLRRRYGLQDVKIVLITNASCLARPGVKEALSLMDSNNGEVWVKLDAGTDDYFRKVNRTNIPFETVLNNILEAARVRPLVIQSLWMRIDGAGPPSSEIRAYCGLLNNLLSSGGRLKELQLHTIARPPAEKIVSALKDEELDGIAGKVRKEVPVPVKVFYGVPVVA
ncbi:MAG: radical SAM protein [Acidobacteriota bacterium]